MASPEHPAQPVEEMSGGISDSTAVPVKDERRTEAQNSSSTTIEMQSIATSSQAQAEGSATKSPEREAGTPEAGSSGAIGVAVSDDTQSAPATSSQQTQVTALSGGQGQANPTTYGNTSGVSPPPLIREATAPAIGPATDTPTPLTKETTTDGPVLYITLLLASTGGRHPFRLDGKYLKKRGVEVEGNNPINMSLYKLKELILRDWREDWNARPSSPEAIRLITMGKLLNDKSRLADSGFTNGLTPHIVHMTVKPQDIIDEEEANKATARDRDPSERSPSCRCVIQ